MAQRVSEIMNHELFTVRGNDTAQEVLSSLLAFGITAAPVIDEAGHPLGVVSLRDLVQAEPTAAIFTRMSTPAASVRSDDNLTKAAEIMADEAVHHLVVTNDAGVVVGFVSVLDALRALIGRPTSHPSAFPHYDPKTGMRWSDDRTLDESAILDIPAQPGLFLLSHGAPGQPDAVVWTEASANLHARLAQILETPNQAPPHLAAALAARTLRVRFAVAPSARALLQTVHNLGHA